jgi:hypothetical protein
MTLSNKQALTACPVAQSLRAEIRAKFEARLSRAVSARLIRVSR